MNFTHSLKRFAAGVAALETMDKVQKCCWGGRFSCFLFCQALTGFGVESRQFEQASHTSILRNEFGLQGMCGIESAGKGPNDPQTFYTAQIPRPKKRRVRVTSL